MRIAPRLGLATGLALVASVLVSAPVASAQPTGCQPGQHEKFKANDNTAETDFTYWDSTKCGTGRARIKGWVKDTLSDERAGKLTVNAYSGLTKKPYHVTDGDGAHNAARSFDFELHQGFNASTVCIYGSGWRDSDKTCVSMPN